MAKQLDILIHAQDYLNELNCGRDPLSGLTLPESSAARETDVRKLFFFSSKNLAHMIAYDDTAIRPRFYITPKQQEKLSPQNSPVNINTLLESINRTVSMSQCRGLGQNTVYRWLEDGGYLQRDAGKRRKPTALGRSLGIVLDPQRFCFQFDRNAQQFIIDHLQDISQFNRAHTVKNQKVKVQLKDPTLLQANLQGMELLSQGTHPYTNVPLDPQDPLNQERLRKCFAYTAWAMGRSLEAGYFTAKAPFTLPQERWKDIEISQEPVVLREFVRKINELLPDPTAVQSLTSWSVCTYLISCGLLEEVSGTAGRRFFPTSAGNALGIEKVEETNSEGESYTYVLYNAAAQQYLVDHLAEIIALDQARSSSSPE